MEVVGMFIIEYSCSAVVIICSRSISMSCCYFGLSAAKDYRTVPVAVRRGIVYSLLAVFMADLAIRLLSPILF